MGTFTHEDTGYNTSTSSTSLTVTLSNAVAAGDLLVLWVQSEGAGVENTSVRDDAGNVWTNAYNGELWYCATALAAPQGVTITATVTTNAVYQMIADRFTPSGPVIFGGYAVSGSAGTLGLNYNDAGCGDLGTVPAGALAWGAFSVNSGTGDQSYTPGFQTDKTSPADVIGSQFNGANGTGLSMYVTDCANEDATLTWYGTGTGAIGSSGSMWFTHRAFAPGPVHARGLGHRPGDGQRDRDNGDADQAGQRRRPAGLRGQEPRRLHDIGEPVGHAPGTPGQSRAAGTSSISPTAWHPTPHQTASP